MAVDLRVVAGSVLALVLAAVFLYFALGARARPAAGPPVVVLTGPSQSGKTALFQLWADPAEDAHETVLSVQPNRCAHAAAAGGRGLVDLPGHEKLTQFTHDALAHANVQAVVFVLDASSGVAGVQLAAERLFALLEVAEQRRIPVLVAANKFDLFNTLSVKKIRAVLEETLGRVRDTQARTVPASEDEAAWQDERAFLGLDGKPFEFDDLETRVDVLEGSVKTRRTAKWDAWLHEL